jgi:hypothetical protein
VSSVPREKVDPRQRCDQHHHEIILEHAYTHTSAALQSLFGHKRTPHICQLMLFHYKKNQKNHIHLFCDSSAQRAPIFERDKYPSHFKPSQPSYFSSNTAK